MDTVYSNFDQTLFLTKRHTEFDNDEKKYSNVILSNTTDDTLTNLKKLTLKIPNTTISFTNNNYVSVMDNSVKCVNNTAKYENNVSVINDTEFNKSNICSKIRLKFNKTDIKKNVHLKNTNKKQRNISFSNEKLWEINRVNIILHNKISKGVKPIYSRQNPAIFVKATSTINREKKNKDIVKANEVSYTKVWNFFKCKLVRFFFLLRL